jgi:hypothetical protein
VHLFTGPFSFSTPTVLACIPRIAWSFDRTSNLPHLRRLSPGQPSSLQITTDKIYTITHYTLRLKVRGKSSSIAPSGTAIRQLL